MAENLSPHSCNSRFTRKRALRRRSESRTVAALFLLCTLTAIASAAQTFRVLVNFHGTDGSRPGATLVQARDGNLYGTTISGGATGSGTIFKITPDGKLTTLYNLCSQAGCADGSKPGAALFQATNGSLYGTTYSGGAISTSCPAGCGTVFRITTSGKLTTLYDFCARPGCLDGSSPGPLVQASDGNFFGTTYGGGSNGNYGTIFGITPEGKLNTLYDFCAEQSCRDGSSPNAGLIQSLDGNLYGTTTFGGAADWGTVFRITTSGALTTVYSFCAHTNCFDGADPQAGVIQATDGNFYGTTYIGGRNQLGTVFQLTATGSLTTLYSFCPDSKAGCPDGSFPYAGLVQGMDGLFYGTTLNKGIPSTHATIFRITPSGALTTLHSFAGADGSTPYAGLVQARNGLFYGTAYSGGVKRDGTVFTLSVGP